MDVKKEPETVPWTEEQWESWIYAFASENLLPEKHVGSLPDGGRPLAGSNEDKR
jgi:hypothetical protein